MFKRIRIQNFRSHKDSSIELADLTLLIGSNNSGKSNFFAAMHFFSRLISNSNPDKKGDVQALKSSSYFSQKHSLSKEGEPISFQCEWDYGGALISYVLSIFTRDDDIFDEVFCNESLQFTSAEGQEKFEQGYDISSNRMLLRGIIKSSNSKFLAYYEYFFRDLSSFYYYNFQPSFLKGEGVPIIFSEGKRVAMVKKSYIAEQDKKSKSHNIPYELGREGANLQDLLLYIKEFEEETYNRFFGYLKRFVKNFNGLMVKDGQVKWQFDMGGSNFPFYEPERISDGIVKAAAVALLCSLRRPPALILLEEVENGINQKKLSEFLSWLVHASDGGNKTQFILSSHSPSVIREFAAKLDTVYNVHLREKDYASRLTNLNEAIKPLVNMGVIDEDSIIFRNGTEVVQIKPYQLVELFYNGVLGEL